MKTSKQHQDILFDKLKNISNSLNKDYILNSKNIDDFLYTYMVVIKEYAKAEVNFIATMSSKIKSMQRFFLFVLLTIYCIEYFFIDDSLSMNEIIYFCVINVLLHITLMYMFLSNYFIIIKAASKSICSITLCTVGFFEVLFKTDETLNKKLQEFDLDEEQLFCMFKILTFNFGSFFNQVMIDFKIPETIIAGILFNYTKVSKKIINSYHHPLKDIVSISHSFGIKYKYIDDIELLTADERKEIYKKLNQYKA